MLDKTRNLILRQDLSRGAQMLRTINVQGVERKYCLYLFP